MFKMVDLESHSEQEKLHIETKISCLDTQVSLQAISFVQNFNKNSPHSQKFLKIIQKLMLMHH